MIDDDDVDFASFAWPAGGLFISLLGLVVIILLWYTADKNKTECAAMKCKMMSASPKLIKHECLCVEKAEP